MADQADPFRLIQDLWHFTDRRNLPKIKEAEAIFATAFLRAGEMDFTAGGDETSLELDRKGGWDQFVHLSFTSSNPMAHPVSQRQGMSLYWLKIDRLVLYEADVKFATGIAYAQGVETVPLLEACERGLIDYRALYDWTDWSNPLEWQKRSAAEKCEILVPTFIDLKFIKNMPNG